MAVIINASTSTGLVQSADTSGQINIQSNGTTVLGVTSTGTSVTGTQSVSGNLSFNSGYGSSAVSYGCRAWVTFNGTGTPAIRASGNVSSIGDFGTGDYSISFTTNMPDSNYTIVGSSVKAGGAPSGDNSAVVIMGESPSVSATGVGILTVNGGALDRGYIYVAVFR